MSEQSNAAAERSAHVVRAATRTLDVPVVEITPGVWKLRIVAELEAERDALRALLAEAADEIEAAVTAQHAGMEHYPSERRRKDRDMDIVRRIRAAVGEGGNNA